MTSAVLVMAYGTPTDADDVENFYTDVRHGHPPSKEQLTDLERRYRAIGGVSPLRERTDAQIVQLQRALDELLPNNFTTFYGAKHSAPQIEQSINEIANQGFDSMIGLVLAPHYSTLSVGEYIERAKQHASAIGLKSAFIERWGDDPILIDLLAARVAEALAGFGTKARRTEVLFSAHSLPSRILELGDRYPDELRRTAELVADRTGIEHFRTAWQSAGRTPEPWLGPDLLSLLDQLANDGVDAIVVCPAGFTSDHLEILYDLDIEARRRAEEVGLMFARTRSLNNEPKMSQLLAQRIVALADKRAELVSHRPPRVIVIGGGISGLVAAHDLQRDHDVALIEASDRLGGKIATTMFRGRPLDLGADAFITRNRAALELCTELGLSPDLIEPSTAGAAVYANKHLHPLPRGLVFGIPTDLRALFTSGIAGRWGTLAVVRDLLSPTRVVPNDIAATVASGAFDPTVGEIFVGRLGRLIVSRLIDPLVGGINASDVNQLSFYAAMPQIAEQLVSARSIVRRLRIRSTPPTTNTSSIFAGLAKGMAQLVDALETDLVDNGTAILRNEPVQSLEKKGAGFVVTTTAQILDADYVILATPAYVSADLLAPLSPTLAKELAAIPYASVATVSFAWPLDGLSRTIGQRLGTLIRNDSTNATLGSEHVLPGSGVLVSREEGLMISAATFTSSKWPRSANTGEVVLRASLGRHGDDRAATLSDDALVDELRSELAQILNIRTPPLDIYVHRWPKSFPQYVQGHIARTRRISELASCLGVDLVGAAYRGIGIPSCIESANAAADVIRTRSTKQWSGDGRCGADL